MTVITTVSGFQGLAADAKPTVGVSLGATFVETDTNKVFNWNGIAWSSGTATLSEVQFLQSKADAGKLIFASGSTGTVSTVVCSYTPANATTFVLYQAKAQNLQLYTSTTGLEVRLRNNGTMREVLIGTAVINGAGVAFTNNSQFSSTKGDILVGNGALTYDIFNFAVPSLAENTFASFEGYLE